MFTGIVQLLAPVALVEPRGAGLHFGVAVPATAAQGVPLSACRVRVLLQDRGTDWVRGVQD